MLPARLAAVALLAAGGAACADPGLLVVPPPQQPRTVQPIAPPRSTAPSSEVERRLLDAHNAERARVGVAPLRWADSLEAEARVWARQLIGSSTFAHDPAPHGHGENLWTGWGGRVWTPEEMVGEWAAERADYRHGPFPNVSRTGNWAEVAHYTQLVWRDTTHVGCAVESRGDRSVLACRYAPPGNIDGRTAY
ncbi:CAP domain-containing protein [Brevundimonas viscosa]|uniref:Cysteine-rich secretory protein family protein n=1 Tax=Brevundimonas viscosa TaxID=871741 RepID=A0A1I6TK17_9CAUL|nr:CAP domain-containing protein [Brevundimonas viscosa]SFS89525.1 Cysteine-rich secretory protein family protein [Brevundimonas viscosa]